MYCIFYNIFSRMHSKGSRFTLGVWGLRVCSPRRCVCGRNRPQPSATVRNRPQPSATVRNRPQPSVRTPYGRAYGKFCRGGHFWRCPMCRCFVSRGRHGTSCNVSKIVLRGRRNTFATFSEDSVAGVAICEMCWKLTEASHETSILR